MSVYWKERCNHLRLVILRMTSFFLLAVSGSSRALSISTRKFDRHFNLIDRL
jgi:hypothetical protein